MFINITKFIQKKLREGLSIPFRVSKNLDYSDEEIELFRKVTPDEIRFNDLGGLDNIAHLEVLFPFKTKATKDIIIDIQIIKNTLYQVHITIPKKLHGLGLGYKICVALITDLGHLYSGFGRVLNPTVNKIWDKLSQENNITCKKGGLGNICVNKKNKDYEKLLSLV